MNILRNNPVFPALFLFFLSVLFLPAPASARRTDAPADRYIRPGAAAPDTTDRARQRPPRSQDPKQHPDKPRMTPEDIDAQKIAYFTRELELTPEEAARFWPLYYRSWDERTAARDRTMDDLKKLNSALNAAPARSDAEIKPLIEAYLKSQEEESRLMARHFDDFCKVLPLRKAARIFHAEEHFRILLIRQLRTRP